MKTHSKKKYLKGKLLVDLGCGGRKSRGAPWLLKDLDINIKSYIGVDRFNAEERYEDEKQITEDTGMPVIYVKEDMLRFVSMLPDDSANYFMNGIDRAIIRGNEYWEKLTKEIYRSMEKGGVVLGWNVGWPQNTPFADITPKVDSYSSTDLFIYEKRVDNLLDNQSI